MEQTKEYINNKLIPLILQSGEKLEGNIFMTHRTLKYSKKFTNKIQNIINVSSTKNNILEIGFNSGFSSLLMLISNPKCNITCVDIGVHKYTIPCYNQIKKDFGERINLIVGDSLEVVPTLIDKFDLIHIDGCHHVKFAEKDIINTMPLLLPDGIVIFDDFNFPRLNKLFNKYIEIYNLKDIEMLPCKYHSIKKK